ncbi:MAG: thiolase family protein [Chloroflexi bacterium]|nr:thiolase family protein [Chloroflexota bacterium]
MRTVFVAGVGMTRFARQPERGLKDLAGEAIRSALADASVVSGQLQACYFANAVAGSITGQEMVAGQHAVRAVGIDRIPVVNVENACASASSAFHLAWQAVAYGIYDIVIAVGAEKLSHPDKQVSFAAIGGALDVERFPAEDGQRRSPFMDVYAKQARDYMDATGATVRDFAAIVVKNLHNGSLNERAQYGSDTSIEEVLSGRQIVWPLTLQMCSPISDGAAAAVLMSDKVADKLQSRVRVAASVLVSGVDEAKSGSKSATIAARQAFEQAGLGPEDLDCVEVHDAAAPAELSICEQIDLASPGNGPDLIRSGAIRLGGRIPVNTSGGLCARGHPIGATGLAQLFEATQQVRGVAGDRQVADARVAMTQNGGGWIDTDMAANSVHILTQ